MSTIHQIEKIKKCESVIVRAFGDEPVQLRAIGFGDGLIEVAGRDKASICLPSDHVFVFDDGSFAALKLAYESGNTKKLGGLWNQLKQFSAARLSQL